MIADPGLWGILAPLRGMAAQVRDARGRARPGDGRRRRRRQQLRGDGHRPVAAVALEHRPARPTGCTGSATSPATLKAASAFTLDGRAEAIRCPTLLTAAEDDALSQTAGQVLDALTCPKTLIRFTAAEGAGDHCEMGNRSLLNSRALDWLDETLG